MPGSESGYPDPATQTAVLNFVQYVDIVLTITAKNGRQTIVYDEFPENSR
ncbi:MAG TPA: hypothetical protein VE264_07470 [Nitrososphaera sp.]|nr:hypothetical protein [Nitrososphaera sp.]